MNESSLDSDQSKLLTAFKQAGGVVDYVVLDCHDEPTEKVHKEAVLPE